MTTFITGGASVIGLVLAQILKDNGRQVLFGSRSGKGIPEGFESVKFDWEDHSTFLNAFAFNNNHTPSPDSEQKSRSIDSVYILPPPFETTDPTSVVAPFVELAREKGVKRFILLTGYGVQKTLGNDMYGGLGRLHAYLEEKGLDYFVLRPSWFMENIFRPIHHPFGTRRGDELVSSIPTAKMSFVAVEDIARVAYDAIVADKLTVTEKQIIGPEALSYDEVAEILSEVLGRKITHKAVSTPEIIEIYKQSGMTVEYAEFLAGLNTITEERSKTQPATTATSNTGSNSDLVYVGRVTFREWAERNKGLFEVGRG